MKTRIYIILFIAIFTTTLNAQRFKGGILAGLNASQIDGDSWGGYYKTGLLLGAFVNTEFRNNFGGQLEIKYAGKGSSNHPKSLLIQKIKLNYIDLPILVTYTPMQHLQIEGGLSLNYLFKAEAFNGDWENMFDWFETPNKLETAITVGINYTFFQNFDVNVRYNYSIYPVRSVYSGSSLGEGAWFNNVVSFALYFHIGRRE